MCRRLPHTTRKKAHVAACKLGIPPKDRAEEGILWYIRSHGLTGGDRLPSERELAERIGVSRTALRAAITQLIAAHILESRQGSGTYVQPPKPLNIFQETYNFSEAVRAAGMEPGSVLIYARVAEVDEALAPRIELEPGSPVLEMRRVRTADGCPVSIETAYVNLALCPGIEGHDFSVESLYDVLDDEYGVRVAHGVEQISITRLEPEEAALLDVDAGLPVFFERAIEYDSDHTPVEYLKSVIIPSRFRFASDGGDRDALAKEVDRTWLMA